ncbi:MULTISPECIES: STAS domain-containing protein [unclassified Thioalkalivibrio]|uniref:STAS domain-containing protein n=1 Tax=unclassified Thioalkalivibrio TaxID=2621013 RepID=UPI00037502E7|nr:MULTISPECIES: STAS domain-containing protein [unclassified Thioalkalivibrio]
MTTIALPERLRIDTAAECWQELRAALDAGEDLQVDAAAVNDVDAAGVQVLLMARHSATRNAQGCSLSGTSAVLAQALQALGVPDEGFASSAAPHDDKDSGDING